MKKNCLRPYLYTAIILWKGPFMKPQMKKDFATLLEESFEKRKKLEVGASYTGFVTSIKEDFTFIKIVEEEVIGIISSEEFAEEPKKPSLKDNLQVYFLKESHGDYYFTVCLTSNNLDFDGITLAHEKGIPVQGQIGAEIQGGYEVKLGEYIGFCPYSQIDSEKKGKPLQGIRSKFVVNEIKNRKIVVSQKKISDREKQLKKEILQAELKPGQYVSCNVKSIHNFGLIVDMNGVDALVPASEATFKKNFDLNKEFTVGQNIRAKILTLDWKENKVSLSLKDLIDDPWVKNVVFKEGDIVSGTIESIKPFGIFVKLNDHFHALVPNKETGLPPRASTVGHFKSGDVLDVFITEVNPEKRQIAASISKAKEAREKMDYQSYISDQKVESTSSFGLLLKKNLKK